MCVSCCPVTRNLNWKPKSRWTLHDHSLQIGKYDILLYARTYARTRSNQPTSQTHTHTQNKNGIHFITHAIKKEINIHTFDICTSIVYSKSIVWIVSSAPCGFDTFWLRHDHRDNDVNEHESEWKKAAATTPANTAQTTANLSTMKIIIIVYCVRVRKKGDNRNDQLEVILFDC